MDERINEIGQVREDARMSFGALTSAQLNWKPDVKSWSVAQCFDHLITTHTLYFPVFDTLANSRPSFWEKFSPLSGFFGKYLIKSLDPKNLKKIKTTSKAQPSSSEIGGDIIERFCAHQDRIIESLRKLAPIDAKNTIITSPLMGIVTYSLDDTFTIIAVHCRRHFNQAKRVTEAEGFPT